MTDFISITVKGRADLVYETRAAIDAALRAEKRGQPYARSVMTGAVEVTVAVPAEKSIATKSRAA